MACDIPRRKKSATPAPSSSLSPPTSDSMFSAAFASPLDPLLSTLSVCVHSIVLHHIPRRRFKVGGMLPERTRPAADSRCPAKRNRCDSTTSTSRAYQHSRRNPSINHPSFLSLTAPLRIPNTTPSSLTIASDMTHHTRWMPLLSQLKLRFVNSLHRHSSSHQHHLCRLVAPRNASAHQWEDDDGCCLMPVASGAHHYERLASGAAGDFNGRRGGKTHSIGNERELRISSVTSTFPASPRAGNPWPPASPSLHT